MFRHLAWAVGSHSSGPTAARNVGTMSKGGVYYSDGSPVFTFTPTLVAGFDVDLDLVIQRLDEGERRELGRIATPLGKDHP